MGETNTLKVKLGNYDYVLKSEDSKEHLLAVSLKVEDKMKTVKRFFPDYATPKVALLVALQLADELLKLEEEYNQLLDAAEKARF